MARVGGGWLATTSALHSISAGTIFSRLSPARLDARMGGVCGCENGLEGRLRNLFSFAGGTGNTGYSALPLVFALFDPRQIVIAVFIIGVNLHEFTIGYFIAARNMLDPGTAYGGSRACRFSTPPLPA